MTTGILHLHLALGLVLFALLFAGKVPRLRALSAITALLVLATGLFNFMTQMKGAPAGWHAGVGHQAAAGAACDCDRAAIWRGGRRLRRRNCAKWRKSALVSGVGDDADRAVLFSNFAR
jgi:hypothetical protein